MDFDSLCEDKVEFFDKLEFVLQIKNFLQKYGQRFGQYYSLYSKVFKECSEAVELLSNIKKDFVHRVQYGDADGTDDEEMFFRSCMFESIYYADFIKKHETKHENKLK